MNDCPKNKAMERYDVVIAGAGPAGICAALEAISVETLTPIEAMNQLYELKMMLQ